MFIKCRTSETCSHKSFEEKIQLGGALWKYRNIVRLSLAGMMIIVTHFWTFQSPFDHSLQIFLFIFFSYYHRLSPSFQFPFNNSSEQFLGHAKCQSQTATRTNIIVSYPLQWLVKFIVSVKMTNENCLPSYWETSNKMWCVDTYNDSRSLKATGNRNNAL